jgi:dihydroxy-acid dehydratase
MESPIPSTAGPSITNRGPVANLAARRAAWQAPPPHYERGYGWMFSRHIMQADTGCDFDFLETSFGAPVTEPVIY